MVQNKSDENDEMFLQLAAAQLQQKPGSSSLNGNEDTNGGLANGISKLSKDQQQVQHQLALRQLLQLQQQQQQALQQHNLAAALALAQGQNFMTPGKLDKDDTAGASFFKIQKKSMINMFFVVFHLLGKGFVPLKSFTWPKTLKWRRTVPHHAPAKKKKKKKESKKKTRTNSSISKLICKAYLPQTFRYGKRTYFKKKIDVQVKMLNRRAV